MNHAPNLRIPALLTSCALALAACAAERSEPPPRDSLVPEPDKRVARLQIDAIDKIDVLFVVDDSGSMAQEQAALAKQLPRMARALATGDLDDDGTPEFPPPADVQLGVVSPNMGLPGLSDIEKCTGLGDDGRLLSELGPASAGCGHKQPPFLHYTAPDTDADQLAEQFSCLAQLGTDGCGFEQPLEAALKALWPSADERVRFHGVEPGMPTSGHGDGANLGFSRAATGDVPSLLVIVLLTDEDDCSASDLALFTPNSYLDPTKDADARLLAQGLNVRCTLNPERLYPVERYAAALRMLRPGAEQLVLFTAIAGVPPERVSREVMAALDYEDDEARAQLYDELLADPQMQERVEDSGTPDPHDDTIRPACTTDLAIAYPARRITELARAFGANGAVQSICQPDFADAVGFVLERVAARMRDPLGGDR
jgi:hypothetical protein